MQLRCAVLFREQEGTGCMRNLISGLVGWLCSISICEFGGEWAGYPGIRVSQFGAEERVVSVGLHE
jgi:hypothetical protein